MFFFFFQAEDGIRDLIVTGVQTCALPISRSGPRDGGRRRDQSIAGGGARAPVRRASRTAERGARLCPPAHTGGGAATHPPRRVAPGNRCRPGPASALPSV